jgi:acetylornithine deacetylase/succinyl-diaminopimelate desuccinylase-like protein
MTYIFETDEESGSKDIVWYLKEYKTLFPVPNLVLCLDSGALDYDRMYLTTSLRGSIKMTIKTQVLNEGVHSGNGSGYVADSFRILTEAISHLEDQKTGKMDESLYVNIPSDKYLAAMKLNEVRKGDFDLKFPLSEKV